MTITNRVHWLSITIWVTMAQFHTIWADWFLKTFGYLEDMGHGAPGFRSIARALAETRVYYRPINLPEEGQHYLSLQFPGNACDAIHPETITYFFNYLAEEFKYQVTRLDFAFDGVPFTPGDFYQALMAGKVRTHANKETFTYIQSPHEKQDEGEGIGCYTANVGAPQSMRKLRVYNRRGFTRLELECKKERADRIAKAVLVKHPREWGRDFIGHLRDYIDLVEDQGSGMLVGFWAKFVQSTPKANLKVTDPREVEKSRLMEWLMTQVAPAFSVMLDIYGEESYKALYTWGRKNRGDRYNSILPTE